MALEVPRSIRGGGTISKKPCQAAAWRGFLILALALMRLKLCVLSNTMNTIDQLLCDLALSPGGAPIYLQIRDQLLAAMGAGVLAPGDRMPTMREVAVAMRVDLNTVRRAYEELERMGAVVLQQGRGSFVAEPAATLDAAARAGRLEALVAQVEGLSAAQGVEIKDLARALLTRAGEGEIG